MYVIFDIGASKMRIASSKNASDILQSKIIPTPERFEDGMAAFKSATTELAAGEKIEATAGGVAGPLDKERSGLLNPPNLPLWANAPIKSELEIICQSPVYLENDTAIVGLGEATAGAGKDKNIVAYVTVSSGVNGARIVNGEIDRSAMGFEIGQQVINFNEKPGDLESYISGQAFRNRFGKKPYEINDPNIWDEAAQILAFGLNNVVVFWSPDIIILGGAMILGNPAISVERTKQYLNQILKIFSEPPPVEKAALGDVGGLYGGLAFLRQNI